MKRILMNAVLTGLVLCSFSISKADVNDDIAAIKQIENTAGVSSVTNKPDFLTYFQSVTSPDWSFTLSDGSVMDYKAAIDMFKSGAYKIKSYTNNELNVRVYGDYAVCQGIETEVSTFNGGDSSGTYRFTDTFLRRNGNWQQIASHQSLIPKDNTAEVTKIVTQLENDWTVASDKGDAKRMAEIMAPDWINIRSLTGAIESRDEYIKRNVEESKSLTQPSSFEISNVRVMGDVAVVTGIFTGETTLNGKLVHDKERFQDVFNKRNGVWVVVNSDNTSIK
jgi:ketosteroid isomerase-like protein